MTQFFSCVLTVVLEEKSQHSVITTHTRVSKISIFHIFFLINYLCNGPKIHQFVVRTFAVVYKPTQKSVHQTKGLKTWKNSGSTQVCYRVCCLQNWAQKHSAYVDHRMLLTKVDTYISLMLKFNQGYSLIKQSQIWAKGIFWKKVTEY